MKENTNFDLHQLIQNLLSLPQPYSQITLLTITTQLLEFTVYKPIRSKRKKYKIICKPDQIMKQLRVLASAILKFSVCKLVYSRNYSQVVQSEDRLLLFRILRIITFQQILIEQAVQDLSATFTQINENFRVLKISFKYPVCLKTVAQFIFWLHERLVVTFIILSIQITEVVENQLIYFTQKWINSLPNIKKCTLPHEEIKFGYPFNQSLMADSKLSGRKQQISLFFKQKQIVTVRQLQQQGRFFILTSGYPLPFLQSIIHLLFRDQKGVNLQILTSDHFKLIDIVQYVSLNFKKGFRINIGNQLQLSYNRMILNTMNMSEIQVMSLMAIGKKSGIYQVVMYSDMEYFEAALNFFMKKPFIKFNFFMPLDQLTPKIRLLIKMMETHCAMIRVNAYSFAGMLKHHGQRGYAVVNSLFCSLAEYSD